MRRRSWFNQKTTPVPKRASSQGSKMRHSRWAFHEWFFNRKKATPGLGKGGYRFFLPIPKHHNHITKTDYISPTPLIAENFQTGKKPTMVFVVWCCWFFFACGAFHLIWPPPPSLERHKKGLSAARVINFVGNQWLIRICCCHGCCSSSVCS